MVRRFSEYQVGLLTVIALVVLVGGMMWLKNIDLTKGSRLYQVDFARVEGMRVGDKVQVRGIRMGEVTDMHIMQSAVRVELALDETVDLREDAVVTLGEKGIVGEVVIEIDPGTGDEVLEGHIFSGRTAGTIASMTDAAGAALAEMRELTRKVTELVEQVREEGKVTETLVQANETLVKVDQMVEQNHSDVVVILENLRVTTDKLRELMESERIGATIDTAQATLTTADSLMVNLQESSRRLNAILTEVESGDGTAAKLLRDDSLYVTADSTMTSLKRLLDEMRRNPKKYFKLNVMDF
jgi:phospholipid/cholesterol/gamma-HCH transport system substrate-binding protein